MRVLLAYNVDHLYIYLEPCWSQSAFVYIMTFTHHGESML